MLPVLLERCAQASELHNIYFVRIKEKIMYYVYKIHGSYPVINNYIYSTVF
jgi:hypothetical protein